MGKIVQSFSNTQTIQKGIQIVSRRLFGILVASYIVVSVITLLSEMMMSLTTRKPKGFKFNQVGFKLYNHFNFYLLESPIGKTWHSAML